MPRLDKWLVKEGHFSSRQTAKRAIKSGHVTVNGEPAKPSTNIVDSDSVVIASAQSLDRPVGFEKLRRINEAFGSSIVEEGYVVLDIGSSAGGFLLYCSEVGASCTGIEVSEVFVEDLLAIAGKHENTSVVIGDAFTISPETICPAGTLDVLLIDVTTTPEGTVQLARRYSQLLKKGGWLVLAIKTDFHEESTQETNTELKEMGFTDTKALVLSGSKKEYHLVSKRR